MVVTISPNLSLYNIVVLPAASRPTMRIRISFLAQSFEKSLPKDNPIICHYNNPKVEELGIKCKI